MQTFFYNKKNFILNKNKTLRKKKKNLTQLKFGFGKKSLSIIASTSTLQISKYLLYFPRIINPLYHTFSYYNF